MRLSNVCSQALCFQQTLLWKLHGVTKTMWQFWGLRWLNPKRLTLGWIRSRDQGWEIKRTSFNQTRSHDTPPHQRFQSGWFEIFMGCATTTHNATPTRRPSHSWWGGRTTMIYKRCVLRSPKLPHPPLFHTNDTCDSSTSFDNLPADNIKLLTKSSRLACDSKPHHVE